jgi:GntR family transcriptional regulator, transcriptional repressor for pyruvate dehydrogenase complex
MMQHFRPIKANRASEEVVAQIKEAILLGRFISGSKLPSERELTEEFQISRGVIREAIRILELSGFVLVRKGFGGGAYVTELNLSYVGNAFLDLFQTNKLTIAEVTQVRLYIEPEVARLAALNFNGSHLELLEQVKADEHLPYKSDADRIARLTRVHKVLASICANLFFEAIVRSMLKITADVVLKVATDHNALHGPDEHSALIEAVKGNDGQRAAAEMRHHLERFSDTLIEMEAIYRQRQSEGTLKL